ncbi:phosphopantothenate--cysteine ligase [Streptococcus sp. X16XC17]|uniref:phosphopantothenate--cysteine ligase n=1 Tax=unclassified Streptococcus TaxID=2608887 RepID=UPI00066FEFD6|nr:MULTISPECIES: phosphopantothenate--cysteine ligase [unclassified Streptococcus]TCD46390.1 phosphopantothenate--cysteine ligase [Streptococcus sp. X16XC17]
MKILITSGGTSEAIDRVRAITNQSTGTLGKIMAETFLKAGFEVTLVTTKAAVKPEAQANLTIHEITNVANLKNTLEPLIKTHDVFIHSMAVSDYTPIYMTGIEEVADGKDVHEFLQKENKETKISSKDDYQVLFLKKTPKIISHVKEWNPAIALIGFKLLVDVSVEELRSVAEKSLASNHADMIVANDLTDIKANQHKAYLVQKEGYMIAFTKEEIAKKVLAFVTKN